MLNLGNHTLYLITSLGVGYFVLCDSSYPSVLAYSFLSELNREFITKYERSQIETCKRPYSFIEFDNYIHRARQRYNKPQSLTTKINLSELSTELRLRPAYKITLSEIESVANGYSSPSNTSRLQAVVRPRLNKLFWYDYLSCTLTLLLTFLDLWRGISAVAFTSEKIVGDTSSENGMLFLLEGIFRISQCYLMVLYFKRRILCTWICLVVIALFEWGLSDLRDGWQSILFFAVALFQHFCCLKKTVMVKPPDYTV
nr:PREDICTED: vesicle-trafficking protein SEC22a-like isoform X2 [Bemisia tabaci]